jgi:hypothetical protein
MLYRCSQGDQRNPKPRIRFLWKSTRFEEVLHPLFEPCRRQDSHMVMSRLEAWDPTNVLKQDKFRGRLQYQHTSMTISSEAYATSPNV